MRHWSLEALYRVVPLMMVPSVQRSKPSTQVRTFSSPGPVDLALPGAFAMVLPRPTAALLCKLAFRSVV